jgi:transposase-like protein
MVIETPRPVADVARDLGLNESTLGNWVTIYRRDHPASEELGISERARLKELEKENRELRMERDFLKKAAAYAGDRCQAVGGLSLVMSSR